MQWTEGHRLDCRVGEEEGKALGGESERGAEDEIRLNYIDAKWQGGCQLFQSGFGFL
jgi:hypothetical protein